jgi:site-specific DNA-methyltransferase (adenine-specific)
MLELNQFYNMDCMDGMKEFPDKYFELAIVDPPYGIGQDWKKRNNNQDRYIDTSYKNEIIPGKKYFDELKRVSVDQIIWGYNYFTGYLGPTNYLIFWDKITNGSFYSEGELAYSSKKVPLKIFRCPWDGYRMGHETGNKKIHPHQKPIELYRMILMAYAGYGDKILDTHVGSGSSLIACHQIGHQYVGFEIDKTYYDKATKRLEDEKRQMFLIEPERII